ncbi:MAG TPA: ABC transporter substrate-binding protein [Thermoplasmata archaeon]|nr:ABC transporter substrate-binding protein [Thermoplasmata archaeon]
MDKKMLYAIVAIVVVVLIITAGVLLLSGPAAPRKYQLELWYNNDGHYGDTEDELATVLKSSIESCGKVAVTLKSDPWAVYKQNWANERMPAFLLGWYPDYFDSDDYVSPFLSTSGAASLGSFYSNATMDGWITDEQTTTSAPARQQAFADIQNTLAEDVPYIPLFSGNAHVAYVNDITRVVLHPVSFKWFIIENPRGTEINASTTDKIISLDPASAYDYFSTEIIWNLFDTLLVYEPNTPNLVPALTTGMPTVSADGKNWTFSLRPGLEFSDGTELNATVVARSIDRAIRLDLPGSAAFLLYDVGALGRDPTNGNNTAPGTIEVAPNDRDITFHLLRPVSFFPDLMAFTVAAPVPWTYSQTGEQPSTVGNVIGSGPYMMTQHVPNQLVVLERNLNYYDPGLYAGFGIPTIPVEDQVNINIRLSATSLKQDIETKAVDIVYRTLNPEDIVDLDSRETALGIKVDIGASPQIRYIVFNVNKVTSKAVRQAIAYSVDRAAIDQTVFLGNVEPLYSMIPGTMPFQSPVFQTKYGATQDCDAANALLTGLGFWIWVPTIWIAGER